MSKYFIIKEDKKLAEIMKILLEEGYCTFNDNGLIQYTFKRRPDISRIYGKAKTILELI